MMFTTTTTTELYKLQKSANQTHKAKKDYSIHFALSMHSVTKAIKTPNSDSLYSYNTSECST